MLFKFLMMKWTNTTPFKLAIITTITIGIDVFVEVKENK